MKVKEFIESQRLNVLSRYLDGLKEEGREPWLINMIEDDFAYLIRQVTEFYGPDDELPTRLSISCSRLIEIARRSLGHNLWPLELNAKEIIDKWKCTNPD
ncbi:hypothetical protein H4K58_002546 [Salmonella enterica]|nr:hypothetical protein [Salmonella enterica]EGA0122054.1 hypothetical protein [Salmonella enterica]EGQ2362780.1 hypothetical protein [Salmonella enterica]